MSAPRKTPRAKDEPTTLLKQQAYAAYSRGEITLAELCQRIDDLAPAVPWWERLLNALGGS